MTSRSFTHDGAGNILTDTNNGVTTTWSYSHAGRPQSLVRAGITRGPFRHNAFGLFGWKQSTQGTPSSRIHLVYDLDGNLLLEANANAPDVARIHLAERPAARHVRRRADGRADAPLRAVDHLDRPVMLTTGTKSVVWRATCTAFGEALTITGSETLDARFPGQWFLMETGLHYNWHRWYDPSTGRYTQPDPLGLQAMLSDGPSRYAYARNSPLMYVDPDGLWTLQAGDSPLAEQHLDSADHLVQE